MRYSQRQDLSLSFLGPQFQLEVIGEQRANHEAALRGGMVDCRFRLNIKTLGVCRRVYCSPFGPN